MSTSATPTEPRKATRRYAGGPARSNRPRYWAECTCTTVSWSSSRSVSPLANPEAVTDAASAFRVVHDRVTSVFRHQDLASALAATELTEADVVN